MKLYFENSRGEKRVIAEPKTEEAAMEVIRAFCEERNFKIYYVRTWFTPDGLKKFDVGSWSEFFYLSYDKDDK